MIKTPSGERLHISLFGRRNAGKSSLMNALSGQQAALVSPVPGTTTDPVSRPMELHPLGPVVLVDTAGLDDEGSLGLMRVGRTMAVLDRTDLAVIAVEPGSAPGPALERLMEQVKARGIPAVGAVTRADLDAQAAADWALTLSGRYGLPFVTAGCCGEPGVAALREAIVRAAPERQEPPLLADLLRPGDLVVLVMPQDAGAPRGRLILPQVQALREALDAHAIPVACQPGELRATLAALTRSPDLVVTDSQVFAEVAATVPRGVPFTSFSILMARHKGDLRQLTEGARAIEALRPGDRVLIAETCTHHAQKDDIGTVKLPRWLRARVGGDLDFTLVHGRDMPADLSPYRLVIHCGGCMINRRLMLSRLRQAGEAEVPIVNYGVAIAYLHGVLARTIEPFPELEVTPA